VVVRSLICAALVAGSVAAGSVPAQAASRVDVTGAGDRAAIAAEGSTTLTLRGSGFQSVRRGHGGIYVMFGTVDGAWQPSKGTGGYAYVADSESRSNAGYQRFVAFPGSDTAAEANGGTISAKGSWSTELTVPGVTFTAVNRKGESVQVDCRTDRCGVITVGAHGVVNANNETFTPVTVASGSAGTASARSGAAQQPAATPGTAAAGARSRKPKAAIDPATAVEGHVLTFTATGFRPQEQVVVSLDGGVAAVGSLTTGTGGELAGVLQLPATVRAGTHVLSLTGALSGAAPALNFPVSRGTVTDVAPAADEDEDRGWLPVVFALVSAVVLLGAVAVRAVRFLRRPVEEASHA
jgi:hypothetical protein